MIYSLLVWTMPLLGARVQDLFWQLSIDHNIDVQYQVSGSHPVVRTDGRSRDYKNFLDG